MKINFHYIVEQVLLVLGEAGQQSAQLAFSTFAQNWKPRQALKQQKGVRETKASHKTTKQY